MPASKVEPRVCNSLRPTDNEAGEARTSRGKPPVRLQRTVWYYAKGKVVKGDHGVPKDAAYHAHEGDAEWTPIDRPLSG